MSRKGSDQPTSDLALRNMTNIEHRTRSLFQLLQNLRPRDAEGLGKLHPDASRLYAPSHLRSCENRVLSSNNTRTREYRLRDQLHLAARQQQIHCLDLCLLGACHVTPVSLVTSCKKWTCPPDNHARTFDIHVRRYFDISRTHGLALFRTLRRTDRQRHRAIKPQQPAG